jgi:hypothetical protein
MTYIKTRLPEIDVLKKMYNEDPKRLIRQYQKYDVLHGPIESVSFVEDILYKKTS